MYGSQDYDFTRVVIPGITTANSDTDGDVISLSGAISYDIAPILGIDDGGWVRFAPLARLDYVDISRDGFTEAEAGLLNLTVAEDNFDQAWFSVGVEITGNYEGDNGLLLTPQLDLRYERVLGDLVNANVTNIAGVNGANFNPLSASNDRDLFNAGVGLGIEITDSFSANVRYDGTFSNDFGSHRGSAGFTYKF